MAEIAGRFVGVGVRHYPGSNLGELEYATGDVETVRELLGDAFAGDPLCDPTEDSVKTLLDSVAESMPDGGSLIALWSGHGRASTSGLKLVCSDTLAGPVRGVDARSLAEFCAASGADQVLVIVDTCFSGQAVPDATQIAAALVEAYPPDARHVWVGVLASCSKEDTAVDGRLGTQLRRLLTPGEGPRDPHARRRWSAHNARLRGDDLCDAVLKDWADADQAPRFRSDGSAWWMLPNPLYRAGAPRQVVEHLLQAARGGGPSQDERSWFTGRTAEVNTVVGWVRARQPGVYAVTGSAGTGKSAVVGRVLSLSDPQERERLLSPDRHLRHDDPGVDSVHAQAHARALTTDRLANLLDDGLCDGLLERDERSRNANALLGAVQHLVDDDDGPVPVVLVDGLDEARGDAEAIVDDLLVRLARWATVIVSTRRVRPPGREDTLVEMLAPTAVLDLDEFAESGEQALHGYVVDRLSDVDGGAMDASLVADHVLESTGTADRPFLLARVITDQLRAEPVDTSRPGWESQVATSIETAFRKDLARVRPATHRDVPDGTSWERFARTLLTSLTWAFGAGFPEEEWRVVASALCGTEVGPTDVSWVLDQLVKCPVVHGPRPG